MAPLNNIVVIGSLPGRTATETVFAPEELFTVHEGVPSSTKSMVGTALGLYNDALQVFLRVSTAFNVLRVDTSTQTTTALKPSEWEWETFAATQYILDDTVTIYNTAHSAYICLADDGTLSAVTTLTDNCKFKEIALTTTSVALYSPATTRYLRIGTVTGLEVADYAKTSALAAYTTSEALAGTYATTSALAGYASKTAANTLAQNLTLAASADILRPMSDGTSVALFSALEELLTTYEGSALLLTDETIQSWVTTFITPSTLFTKLVNRNIFGTNVVLPGGSYHCLLAFNNVGFFPNATAGVHGLRGHFIYNSDLLYGTNDGDGKDIIIPVSWHGHADTSTVSYPTIKFSHSILSGADQAAENFNGGGDYQVVYAYPALEADEELPAMVVDIPSGSVIPKLDFKLIRIGDYTYDSVA
jgi:hypothetical protein